MDNDIRLAVLIDAENFSSKYVKKLFDEIAEDGQVSIRRVYGGWTAPQLKPWENVLETYSISTKQECCYSVGKNSSDSAMIIDAMDILYSDVVDGFCIASSDGDFTNLARRIREAGKLILGAGEKKTPKAFVNSCNKFIYVDMPDVSSPKSTGSQAGLVNGNPVLPQEIVSGEISPIKETDSEEEIGPTSLETIKSELVLFFDGLASRGLEKRSHLGPIGNYLRKKHSDFDPRNYNCKTLVELIKKFDEYIIEELPSENDPKVKAIYVACKSKDPN